jgi:hypothetical protein
VFTEIELYVIDHWTESNKIIAETIGKKDNHISMVRRSVKRKTAELAFIVKKLKFAGLLDAQDNYVLSSSFEPTHEPPPE